MSVNLRLFQGYLCQQIQSQSPTISKTVIVARWISLTSTNISKKCYHFLPLSYPYTVKVAVFSTQCKLDNNYKIFNEQYNFHRKSAHNSNAAFCQKKTSHWTAIYINYQYLWDNKSKHCTLNDQTVWPDLFSVCLKFWMCANEKKKLSKTGFYSAVMHGWRLDKCAKYDAKRWKKNLFKTLDTAGVRHDLTARHIQHRPTDKQYIFCIKRWPQR